MGIRNLNTLRGLVLVMAVGATLLAACLLSGCSNSTGPSIAPPEPPDYRTRLTPEDVLANLQTAYIYMDLEPYLDCLAEDFVFYPTADDVHDPNNPIPPEWYKTDERAMHENMFAEESDVESITLTLTNVSTYHDEGNPVDPLDDIYVYSESVDLRVNLVSYVTLLATAPSEFRFRIDQDQQGPSGEVLWEIYSWYDDPVRRGTSPFEQSSWGSIKALYQGDARSKSVEDEAGSWGRIKAYCSSEHGTPGM
jgi:hypothetical protein